MTNRSKFDLMAAILNVASAPALKTEIRMKCGLSGRQYDEFMKLLLESGLLDAFPQVENKKVPGRKSKRKTMYVRTDAGNKFLSLYSEMTILIKPKGEGGDTHES